MHTNTLKPTMTENRLIFQEHAPGNNPDEMQIGQSHHKFQDSLRPVEFDNFSTAYNARTEILQEAQTSSIRYPTLVNNDWERYERTWEVSPGFIFFRAVLVAAVIFGFLCYFLARRKHRNVHPK